MQCPNCDAKDQVTIAGKTFCASCGTLADQPKTDQPTPTQAVQSSPSQQAPQSHQAKIQDEIKQPIGNISRFQTPVRPAVEPASPTPAQPTHLAEPTPTSNLVPQLHVAEPAVIQEANTPVVPAPAGPPPPDANTASRARAAIAHVQTSSPIKPPAHQSPQLTQSVPMTDIRPPQTSTRSTENIGSELSSLDGHDEGVFTDAQLNELAKTPSNTITSARPSSDGMTRQPQAPSYVVGAETQDQTQSFAQPTTISAQQNTASTINPALTQYDTDVTPPAPMAGSTITPQSASASELNPAAAMAATQAASESDTLLAQTNTQSPAKKDRSKSKKVAGQIATAGISVAGVILLGLYVWQINYPNLALKVASSKAGISASLPSYLPNGWKITGDIAANPGSVNYSLQSPDGSKNVTISESRTDWDSQALAENYLSSKANNYTALQAQGLTIYLYNNQASWVNHGTWYRIEGDNNGLTQDQIIKMATSL